MTSPSLKLFKDLLKKKAPAYLRNRLKDIEEINEACSSKDFKKIETFGHKMAGSAGSYGFQEIGDLGTRIEEAAKVQNLELIKNITVLLSKAVEAHAKALEGTEGDDPIVSG